MDRNHGEPKLTRLKGERPKLQEVHGHQARRPHVRKAEKLGAEREAHAPQPPQPRDWSRDIQARQESIRRAYLAHAEELARGEAADRRLAGDIRRFVADMPVPLTRRQALAVELRQVLHQRNAPVPEGPPTAPDGLAGLDRESRPPLPGDTPSLGPTMPKRRR